MLTDQNSWPYSGEIVFISMEFPLPEVQMSLQVKRP